MEHTQFGIKDGPLSAVDTTPSCLLSTLGLSQKAASLLEDGMARSFHQWVIHGTDHVLSPVLGI